MNRVGFILKASFEVKIILDQLVPWLVAGGHEAIITAEDQTAAEGAKIVPEDELGKHIDIAVVLGGDGTMLRASALVADAGVPVLGINLGRLGFLTAFDPANARDAVAAAMAGEIGTSERMRLAVTYSGRDAEPVTRTALNDAVIHQGAMARLIELEARIDGELVARYRADGLIVATPTGSTAYNLAAGGPILIPGQEAMTLTPICAHSLTNRPLVVSDAANISVALGGESRDVVLTVDGQWARSIMPGDLVEITAASRPLIMFQSDRGYFDILREKLAWGARSDRDAT